MKLYLIILLICVYFITITINSILLNNSNRLQLLETNSTVDNTVINLLLLGIPVE